ncbi:hypothetical protein LDENG_00007160, partial [Lucifuga dentata]
SVLCRLNSSRLIWRKTSSAESSGSTTQPGLRTGSAWCSSSSSWAGRCTGTRPSPNAPSSNSSTRWTNGRTSTTEERDGPWSTA